MLGEFLENVRTKAPLVHVITNYVTAHDCANLLLACGASPIMADDPAEVEDVTDLCAGLVLNLGTPDSRKAEAMEKAGKRANALGRPVVLDPVGVGASRWRTQMGRRLLTEVDFALIRGNRTELEALAGKQVASRGVDAADRARTERDGEEVLAEALSARLAAAVAMTGAVDVVTDGKTVYRVANGHPLMRQVTGAGCQLSCLVGAFLAANPDRPLEAAVAAVCAMGLVGEIAYDRMSRQDGNASYGSYIIDALFHLTPTQLEEGARYEIA